MTFEELKQEAMKAKTIDELFEIWKMAHVEEDEPESDEKKTYIHYATKNYQPIEKDSFIADGYISKDDYLNSPIKVLFILREANIVMHRGGEQCKPSERNQKGFYFWYIDDLKSNRPKQQEKMARMAFYLQHPELPEEERRTPDETALKSALKSSGYMNINKRGGGNIVDWRVFDNYYCKYIEFITRQKEIMAPKYVILIGDNKYDLFKDSIRVWHTSYRMKGKKRIGTDYGSGKNVDCYMREFFERVREWEKTAPSQL